MGNFDARLNELKEQLKTAAVTADAATTKKIEEAVVKWGEDREILLMDLIALIDQASATNMKTDEKWLARITTAKQALATRFGDAVKDMMLNPGLQLFWGKALQDENAFIASLSTVSTPRVVDQLNAHQAGLGKVIAELADKWRFLLSADSEIFSREQKVIVEIDGIIKEAMLAATPFKQQVLDVTEILEKTIRDNAAWIAAGMKVLEKIDKIPKGTAEVLKVLIKYMGTPLMKFKSIISDHERNVRSFQELLSLEKGTVLATFVKNREETEKYTSENNLKKAGEWNEEAKASFEKWVSGLPSDKQRTDGAVIRDKILASVKKVWDQTRQFDENFRSEFEGLFLGTLLGEKIELLLKERKFAEIMQGLNSQNLLSGLDSMEDVVRNSQEEIEEKALAAYNEIHPDVSDDERKLILLQKEEVRKLIQSVVENEIRVLLPVIAEVREKFKADTIRQDFSRDELKRQLR
jgi:hypothetical protein